MADISQEDLYFFHSGNAQKAWQTLGVHYIPKRKAYRFCVWAPNAVRVSVIGDFNGWNRDQLLMEPTGSGLFVGYSTEAKEGDCYKYAVVGGDGIVREKADPFAFYSELRPKTASRIYDLGGYQWQDEDFLSEREKQTVFRKAISIYELHLGSWKRKPNGDFYNYRELAELLVPYITEMGFTHIELMPITEHPFDGSWGYQVTGYFSVTARYGTPHDFMYFVDRMHQAGIGVLLDWVPAHFPRDEHGLARFDGTCLYEHQNPLQGEHPHWGTLIFNYGRLEVQSFLLSSGMFFIEQYHIDGLRIDAVSSMLYLDFGRENGGFIPNRYGGNINLEAIELIKKLNTAVLTAYPGVLMIAEESSAYPMVTKPPFDGGLGFTFKWDMGFMNDILRYMEQDPIYRRYHHNRLTFSMHYAFSENYILPFSHDEVVHGKNAMLSKMFGDYWQKFASLRALYGYLYAHPGKKLLFMGDEFAQFIEWDYQKELDWVLLDFDPHRRMQAYVKRLNALYRESPPLYQADDSWEGFQWMNVDDADNSAAAFLRLSTDEKGKREYLLCVLNFTPVVREGYRVALPEKGTLTCILNSDDVCFGGSGVEPSGQSEISVDGNGFLGRDSSVMMTLPPLSAMYFIYQPNQKKSNQKKTIG